MKRIFAVMSMSILMWSTGCTVVQSIPGKTVNPMTGGFTTEVTIMNTDMESKAELTRYGTNAWCIVFSEPQTLAGVQLDFLDDEVKASYKGLEFSVPQSAQAIRTELEELMGIIDNMALNPELNGRADEGKIICDGEIEEGGYSLVFTDGGIPEEFSLPCYDLTVKFENFRQQAGEVQPETTIPVMTETPVTETPETTTPAETTAEEAGIPETIPAETVAEEAVIPEPIPAEPAAVIEEEIPE